MSTTRKKNNIFKVILSGYELDKTQGRIFYFYHDCRRYWKYIRPVRKTG